jgi:hypothetical protein
MGSSNEDDKTSKNEIINKSARYPVIVASIGTGVDSSYEGLENALWSSQLRYQYYLNYNGSNTSEFANGTGIAEIIAKKAAAYGGDIKIMPLNVFTNGTAYTSDIIRAIEFAKENGAEIINLSFDFSQENPALLETMTTTDALFVSAVGNHNTDLGKTPSYPASYNMSNNINVASVNSDDSFASYSDYSSSVVNITAPGRNAFNTVSNTSMSAAQVSSAAAIILSREKLSPEALKERLIKTSDKIIKLQDKVAEGCRLNIKNAINGATEEAINNITSPDITIGQYNSTTNDASENIPTNEQTYEPEVSNNTDLNSESEDFRVLSAFISSDDLTSEVESISVSDNLQAVNPLLENDIELKHQL